MLTKSRPEEARRLMELAQQDATKRWRLYERLAGLSCDEQAEQKAGQAGQ